MVTYTKHSTGDIVCGYQYDFVQGIEDEGGIENFVKYIPADAFIEKAVKYIANHFLAPGMDSEIKDFVNYMERE